MGRIRLFFYPLILITSAAQAWQSRFVRFSEPDFIAYLDVSDHFLNGDWMSGIHNFWGMLYPLYLAAVRFIVNPSPYWELTVTHLAGVPLTALSLVLFDRMAGQLIEFNKKCHPGGMLNEKTIYTIGFSIFFICHTGLTHTKEMTPDIMMSCVVYGSFGLLLRILRTGGCDGKYLVWLGVVLALGYLANITGFIFAAIIIILGIIYADRATRPRFVAVILPFLFIITPYVVKISADAGEFTLGKKSVWTYGRFVMGCDYAGNWQGDDFCGKPIHPARILNDDPTILEFGSPILASDPLLYDLGYWYQGIHITFDAAKQFDACARNLNVFYTIIEREAPALFIIILTCLLLRLFSNKKETGEAIRLNSLVLLFAMAAFAFYIVSVTHIRYLGHLFALLLISYIVSIRAGEAPDKLSSFLSSVCAMASRIGSVLLSKIPFAGKWLSGQYEGLFKIPSGPFSHLLYLAAFISIMAHSYGIFWDLRNLRRENMLNGNVHWKVANELHKLGLKPGDGVATIGYTHTSYWARVGGMRIVSEVQRNHIGSFMLATKLAAKKTLSILATTGAKAAVMKERPWWTRRDGWHALGDTGYHAYLLRDLRHISK